MKAALATISLIPVICTAAPFSIERANVILDIPDEWTPLLKDTYPDAPSNVCFPRFDHKTKTARIDAVIWSDLDSLDVALDRYVRSVLTAARKDEENKELYRSPFKTVSGIEGIKYVFQTSRQTACGPSTWKLVRYVFRSTQGEIVCLGGFGDIEAIDRIVISSLKMK